MNEFEEEQKFNPAQEMFSLSFSDKKEDESIHDLRFSSEEHKNSNYHSSKVQREPVPSI